MKFKFNGRLLIIAAVIWVFMVAASLALVYIPGFYIPDIVTAAEEKGELLPFSIRAYIYFLDFLEWYWFFTYPFIFPVISLAVAFIIENFLLRGKEEEILKENTEPKVFLAVGFLRFSQILYGGFLIFSIFFLKEEFEPGMEFVWIVMGIIQFLFLAGFIVFFEFVIRGLKKYKFWAWVVGIIIFGMYSFSLFLIIGIPGLWSLLNKNTRILFLKPLSKEIKE